jgi:thioester reductase-like protein
VVVVNGDMTEAKCGVSAAQLKTLNGKIKHFFHLAAIYDLTAKAEQQRVANIEGTRNALDLAAAIGAGVFHHTSSIAAAGLYPGVFREDMFEEAEGLDDPYLRTKHDSEGLVRQEKRIKWRIYRPGMVVGHSQTGEMDKVDGPYYFFTFLKKLREMLPPWMPMLGVEGGRINLVPVDYVVDAMDHIAHKPRLDGHCFHLVDPSRCAWARCSIRSRVPATRRDDDAPGCAHVRLRAQWRAQRRRQPAAGAALHRHAAARLQGPQGSPQVHHLSDALRQPRSRAGAARQRYRSAAPGAVRLAPVGLLGAPPRPGPVRRSHAQGQGPQQGGGDYRRIVGHRPGDRAARGRGRRDHGHRRARGG